MATRKSVWLRPAALVLSCAAAASLAGCGGVSTSQPPPSASTSVPAPAATLPAPGGASPYPAPQEETFQNCPPQGDGGDADLNLRKNRIDAGAWQQVSLADLLALTWPPGVERTRRSDWSPSDAATVARDEGRPVVTEGYVLKVRHEGPESPNCHDPGQRDYHTWLGMAPGDSRATSMIVELTPRVVARNPGWGSEQTILRLVGHHVRVAGWLLLDQEHPEQLRQTRGTLWEIHPVMQVSVDQNGSWSDLAAGNVSLGRAPTSSSYGSGAGSSSIGSSSGSHRRRRPRRHRSTYHYRSGT